MKAMKKPMRSAFLISKKLIERKNTNFIRHQSQ